MSTVFSVVGLVLGVIVCLIESGLVLCGWFMTYSNFRTAQPTCVYECSMVSLTVPKAIE